MDKVVSVAIINSTRSFDREYHYLLPERLNNNVQPGVRVVIPFGRGNTSREGYILKLHSKSDASGLKEIKSILDDRPVLDNDLIKLAQWMRIRYICTYSDAFKCMLPAGLNVKSIKYIRFTGQNVNITEKEKTVIDALKEHEGECEYKQLREAVSLDGFSRVINNLKRKGMIDITEEYVPKVREKKLRTVFLSMAEDEVRDILEGDVLKSIQQIRVLEILLENEFVAVSDLIRFANVSYNALNTLHKRNFISFGEIEVKRNPFTTRNVERTMPLTLTLQQQKALSVMKGKLENKNYEKILLHGVTGSGKTEVYMQLINDVIAMGREAIVLVPEISLTPQMVKRFRGRFGDDVAVMHSRLSLGEKYDQWRLVREGKIKVVVGARSAIFAPLKNLGAIIIDEEHENSYKSEITPKYDARDIARIRCIQNKCLMVLGSATPSIESYFEACGDKAEYCSMTERANNLILPKTGIVDMRSELESGNRSIFSKKLIDEIKSNIEKGQQTLLLLNRRGHSSFVMCRGCGYAVKCTSCNITMTYHSLDKRLICHYCGYTLRLPQVCPKCKSRHIRFFGIGTQKVEEQLYKEIPGCSVVRMDMDTTKGKNSHEKLLDKFQNDGIDILVGTQMIAKGHDFPNVTLVGVLAADATLNIDDFRASEKTFQLLTQVAGRAGRGNIPGRVIIQTYNIDDYSITAACRHDYKSFYRHEILVRKNLNYPPFANIAVIILRGKDDKNVREKAQKVFDRLKDDLRGYKFKFYINGPKRAPLSRIKKNYRWRIVLKCTGFQKTLEILTKLNDGFDRKYSRSGVELSVDINPLNMV